MCLSSLLRSVNSEFSTSFVSFSCNKWVIFCERTKIHLLQLKEYGGSIYIITIRFLAQFSLLSIDGLCFVYRLVCVLFIGWFAELKSFSCLMLADKWKSFKESRNLEGQDTGGWGKVSSNSSLGCFSSTMIGEALSFSVSHFMNQNLSFYHIICIHHSYRMILV